MNGTIDIMTAIKRMKEFTEAGIPFRFTYMTLSGKHKVVESAFIRPGYSKKQSKRWKYLIGYTDLRNNEHRQLHRSLLMEVNGVKIVR